MKITEASFFAHLGKTSPFIVVFVFGSVVVLHCLIPVDRWLFQPMVFLSAIN